MRVCGLIRNRPTVPVPADRKGTVLGWSGGYDDLLYAIAEKYDTVTYSTPPPRKDCPGSGRMRVGGGGAVE